MPTKSQKTFVKSLYIVCTLYTRKEYSMYYTYMYILPIAKSKNFFEKILANDQGVMWSNGDPFETMMDTRSVILVESGTIEE